MVVKKRAKGRIKPMNKVNFEEIFDAVQMDENAKAAFLAMRQSEQLLAILGMQAWMRNEIATTKRAVLKLRDDFDVSQEESKRYRKKIHPEAHDDEESEDEMGTTQKVINSLYKRFSFVLIPLQNALSTVFTVILLALLYLAFGGKLPTP